MLRIHLSMTLIWRISADQPRRILTFSTKAAPSGIVCQTMPPASDAHLSLLQRILRAADGFHLGKPILVMLIIALLAAAGSSFSPKQKRADLTLWVFAQQHRDVYDSIVGEFHDKTGLTVDVQLVSALAMDLRLSSLFMSYPTSPELPATRRKSEMFWVGKYLRPPSRSDRGLFPLQQSPHQIEAGSSKIVKQRLAPWTKEGTTFGAAHDVHPADDHVSPRFVLGRGAARRNLPRPTHRSRIHKNLAGISRQMPRVRTILARPGLSASPCGRSWHFYDTAARADESCCSGTSTSSI